MGGCFEPGTIVVLPKSPQKSEWDVIETTNDVLSMAEQRSFAHPAPKLLQVREGAEIAECLALLTAGDVLAASPNFYIEPAAPPVTFERPELEAMLWEAAQCGADPNSDGKGIKVAVLDSGWSGGAPIVEYYADRRPAPGVPADATGHGTAVIELVRQIVPGADIRSVRICDRVGTLWSLISGLFLAQAAFAPHVVNISMSVKCDTDYCAYCKRNGTSLDQLELIFWSFRNASSTGWSPVVVAAAGNGVKRVSVPASLADVIAVGAFDHWERRPAVCSEYDAVPCGRFLMAPGGSEDPDRAFATVPSGATGRGRKALHGTSFAAPIVTGILARYLSEAYCPRCDGFHEDPTALVLDCLSMSGSRNFTGYDIARHGLGCARYQSGVLMETQRRPRGEAVSRVLGVQPGRLKPLVEAEARSIYMERGMPQGTSEEHWWTARQRCRIPGDIYV